MFPAATAVTVATIVARRCVFSSSSYVKSRYVFSQSAKVAVTVARRRIIVCSAFPTGLPRSVGTWHVFLRCDQVVLHLSSSVKVFYDKTLAMNGV